MSSRQLFKPARQPERPTSKTSELSTPYNVFEDSDWPIKKLSYTDKQSLVRSLVEKYFSQMTLGCGSSDSETGTKNCLNLYCASCPDNLISTGGVDKTAVCTQAIELISQYGNAFLCPKFLFPSNFNGITLDTALTTFNEGLKTNEFTLTVRLIGSSFSVPETLCSSFLKKPTHPLPHCPVDVEGVRALYALLYEPFRDNINNSFLYALQQVVQNFKLLLTRLGSSVEIYHLNIILILLEHPLLQDPASHTAIMPGLCECISMLPNYLQRLLMTWLSDYPSSNLRKILHCFQQYISLRSMLPSVASVVNDFHIQNATKVVGLIYDANTYRYNLSIHSSCIDKKEFANEILSENIDLFETIKKWRLSEGFTFCDFPFMITTSIKSELLKEESVIQMHLEQRDALFRTIFSGAQDPYLSIIVRRDHVIRDALNQIASKPPGSFKKKLRVKFSGEEGIDEGGVQKEFFQLVFRDIMDPIYGMFTYDPASRLCWFRTESSEGFSEEYSLVGLLMGLAIYNSVILDVRLPPVVYKKLCGKVPTLNDLKISHPDLAQGLEKLLHFEGNVEEVFCRVFQIEYEKFGEKVVVDLKENGGEIPLTNENRKEYVDLYVKWVLQDSIANQFQSFKRGFDLVTADSSLMLFEPEEIELLVCGSPQLDFKELEESTAYEGGFTKDSNVIKNFWSIVHEFDEEQKKKLLFFATGSDRVPVGGLSKLQFVIVKNGTDDTRLPTAHTCFNVLMLSEYSSKEKLKERLLTAIQNSEGFGML